MRAGSRLQRRLNEEEASIPAIAADGALYPVGKLDAHRQGLLHQAVSVFVFHGSALLIQRRAAGKYHSPGLWANTCCTHPHWGEAEDRAAARRLREELGFDVTLQPCARLDYRADVGNGLIEHERVQVFSAALSQPPTLRPDPMEVSDWRWATPTDLQAEANDEPARFAPWFRIYLRRWAELGLD